MGIFANLIEKLKAFISISWTYLCVLWFILVLILVYILKGPLKINENLSTGSYNSLNIYLFFSFAEILIQNLFFKFNNSLRSL